MRFFAALFVTVLLAAPLGGCGFTPLYGSNSAQNSAAQDFLSQIAIDNIPDRDGQYLRNRLIDRLHPYGPAAQSRYGLRMGAVQERKTNLDVAKSADATRAQLDISTTLTLRDLSTGREVLRRELSATTSYNILSSQFTTRVSEDNARRNALDDIARQAEQQIMLYRGR